MRKAEFETACVACHKIDYDERLPRMRHKLQPDEVYDELVGRYSALYLKTGAPLVPGKRQAVPGEDNNRPVRGEVMEQIKKDVAKGQKRLLASQQCFKCHSAEGPDGTLADRPDIGDTRPTFRIAPPMVKDVWLPHSRFDHAAHKNVADCQKCHAAADIKLDPSKASAVASDVLIPSVQVCRECHTPHGSKTTNPNGTPGAGSSCTECHGYHNGDKTLGPPAPVPARNAAFEADLPLFLAKARER